MATGDRLSFGPYVLDIDARRLTRDDVEVRIGSRQAERLSLRPRRDVATGCPYLASVRLAALLNVAAQ